MTTIAQAVVTTLQADATLAAYSPAIHFTRGFPVRPEAYGTAINVFVFSEDRRDELCGMGRAVYEYGVAIECVVKDADAQAGYDAICGLIKDVSAVVEHQSFGVFDTRAFEKQGAEIGRLESGPVFVGIVTGTGFVRQARKR